jgi:hypothetical protein
VKNLSETVFAWNDFENIIGEEFNKITKEYHSKMYEEILNFENFIEDFIEQFYIYLNSSICNFEIPINSRVEAEFRDADVLLTFNYTDLYSYYSGTNDVNEIFHIHGSLESDNLPLIGFYYEGVQKHGSDDYAARYNNKVIHKPAMALKQNLRDLESEIKEFQSKYSSRIDTIIVIGYSFGKSDNHIYDILNKVMIEQNQANNMPYIEAESIPKIEFRIFNYDNNETDRIKKTIIENLAKRCSRRIEVNKFGLGIKKEKETLIRFTEIEY